MLKYKFTDIQICYMKKIGLNYDFANIPIITCDDNWNEKEDIGYQISEKIHERDIDVSNEIVALTEELDRELTPEEYNRLTLLREEDDIICSLTLLLS